ncbi:MAG: hypothetical protein KGH79_00970 [Patescibacteria group bacterium]|nr:hypothetical protein [Patescibacteria group bacterium]
MLSLTTLGKFVFAAILLVVVLVGAGVWYLTRSPAGSPVACSADAMQCPDGSWVGRSGPNCEFVCPASAATSTATTTNGGGGSILPYNSGIRGTVMAGPTCPVERVPPDPACADKPLQTLVSIYRASDTERAFATTHSNANGSFEVSLPPGSYVVGAGDPGAILPRCANTPAEVGASGYAAVAVSCDTGIR